MNEYISREEAVEAIQFRVCQGHGNKEHICKRGSCAYCGIMEIISDISSTKAADVQPVKHGRWETWGYIFHGILWKRCSVCGKTADISYQALLDGKIEMATPSICGCCSARMDGDNNG